MFQVFTVAAVYDDLVPPPPEYRDPAWDSWNAPGWYQTSRQKYVCV